MTLSADVTVSPSNNSSQLETSLREGDKEIPVVARLRMEERAQLGDLQNLYVYSSQGQQKVPLRHVSQTEYGMQAEKMRARNQFRTITVSAMPAAGHLASEVLKAARAQLNELRESLPAGYRLEVVGEEEDTIKGFRDLTVVLCVSVVAIFPALVFQFKNAFKPFVVFAAVPYGMVGAGWLIPAGVACALIYMRYWQAKRRDVAAFLSSVAYIAFMLGGAAFAMHPLLLPASTDSAYSLTIYNSQAGAYSLSAGLVWWLPGIALAVLYFVFLYRSFSGKVRLEDGGEGHGY